MERLISAMSDFSDLIDSCNLIDPPLEGGRFTWSSHEEVPCCRELIVSCSQVIGRIISKGCIAFYFLRLLRITFQLCSKVEMFQSSVLSSLKVCGLRSMAFVSW